jgi:hypothetical protein
VLSVLVKEGFAMNNRLFPLSRDVFNRDVLPIIEAATTPLGGRPPKIDHYTCFCAMLKMLSVSQSSVALRFTQPLDQLCRGVIYRANTEHGIRFIPASNGGARMGFYGEYSTN